MVGIPQVGGFVVRIPVGVRQVCFLAVRNPVRIPQVCDFVVRMRLGYLKFCGFTVKMPVGIPQVWQVKILPYRDPSNLWLCSWTGHRLGYLKFCGFVVKIPVGVPQVLRLRSQDPGWDISSFRLRGQERG